MTLEILTRIDTKLDTALAAITGINSKDIQALTKSVGGLSQGLSLVQAQVQGQSNLVQRIERIESSLFSGSGSGIVITSASIAEVLSSTNFVTGVSGWRIWKNGDVEFQSGTFRGDITADSGFFSGTVYVGTAPNRIVIDGANKTLQSENFVTGISGWQITGTGGAEFQGGTFRGDITADSGFFSGTVYVGTAPNRIVIDGANKTLQSENFVTGISGWQITGTGRAEFQDVVVRGAIEASVFNVNQISAISGSQVIVIAAGNLQDDATIPASPTTVDLNISGTKEGTGIDIADVDDILRIKDGVSDSWLKVTVVTNNTTYFTYTCVLQSGTQTTYEAGTAVLNYGQSGDGGIFSSADAANGPYIQVFTHAGSPWSSQTERVRIGNLNGWGDFASDVFGFALGDFSGGSYIYFDPSTPNTVLVNGAGSVLIDKDGIKLEGGQAGINSIIWEEAGSDFTTPITHIYAYTSGTNPNKQAHLAILPNASPGDGYIRGDISLRAGGSATNDFYIDAQWSTSTGSTFIQHKVTQSASLLSLLMIGGTAGFSLGYGSTAGGITVGKNASDGTLSPKGYVQINDAASPELALINYDGLTTEGGKKSTILFGGMYLGGFGVGSQFKMGSIEASHSGTSDDRLTKLSFILSEAGGTLTEVARFFSDKISLYHPTATATDGGGQREIRFTGLQSSLREYAAIVGAHDGASADSKGHLELHTHNGTSLTKHWVIHPTGKLESVSSSATLDMNGRTIILDVDNDTYLYSPSDDVIEYVANSASILQMTSTGLAMLATRVIDLQGNADALVLDADNDTTISAPTDDRIDFEVGGSDVAKFTLSELTFNIATSLDEKIPSNLVADSLIFDLAVDRTSGSSADHADDSYYGLLNVVHNASTPNRPTVTRQVGGSTDPFQYYRRIESQAANTQMGFVYFLENKDTIPLRGELVSLSVDIWATDITNIRVTVIEWTSTADSVTSDVVGTWGTGNPTLATNWAYSSTPGASTPITSSRVRYKFENITIGSGANNIAIFIWTPDAEASGDEFNIARLKLERGAIATEFVAKPYQQDFLGVSRILGALGSVTAFEIYGAGQVAATSRALANYNFQVEMRVPPTITSPDFTQWAFYNNNVTAFVAWVTPSQQVSKYGWLFDISGMAASLGGAGDCALWGPNATSSAYMLFDARL